MMKLKVTDFNQFFCGSNGSGAEKEATDGKGENIQHSTFNAERRRTPQTSDPVQR
jgi:hypothetical protein